MELLSVIAFAVALSLDGFGVGIAYGMRKIRIPIRSLIVISLTSSTAIGVSMLFGRLVSAYVSAKTAEILGAAILIGVGIWILLQTRREKVEKGCKKPQKTAGETAGETVPPSKPILNVKIEGLGLVVQILREPTVADFDKSGFISPREAIMLGLALAMDALGAGFGAAMTGFRPLLTPLVVGIVKFLMVSFGDFAGRRYAAQWLGDRAAVLPGWVLIFLGLARVIKI